MLITVTEATSLLRGWVEDGDLLKVSLFTAANQNVAVVFGSLATTRNGDFVVGLPDPGGGVDLQRSHMIFRLDGVASYELVTAEWAALETGYDLGELLAHGDTMLTAVFETGGHLTLGRVTPESA